MATNKSNPWKNLPQDLVIEILLRLPIKSLLRFSLVSKSWLSLISGPQFKRTYSETSTRRRRRLMFFPTGGAVVAILPFRPNVSGIPSIELLAAPTYFASDSPHDPVRLVGSCNGLVCLVFPRTDSVVVWNPAIRKHWRLPASAKYTLAACYGFGYDSSSDDYKVVEYSHRIREPRFCYSVYSLRNRSWKTSNWPHAMMHNRCGVFVHRAIHWMVGRRDSPTDVIAVNLATEEYSGVPLPAHLSARKLGLLGVSRDRLCLCFPNGRLCWDVWVMQEYGVKESWTMVPYISYCFCLTNLCDLETEPLCFTEKGDVLVTLDATKYELVAELMTFPPPIKVFDRATIYGESFFNPS